MKITSAKFIPRASNKWFWFGLALLIKLAFFIYFLHQYDKSLLDFNSVVIGHKTGDTDSYLEPINNLIQNGSYNPDFRMPGYGFIYLLFRLLFNQLLASNLLVVLQLLLSAVSVYCLALSALYIYKSEKYFLFIFFIYAFSSYPSYFDVLIVTESFSVSTLILNVYFLIKHHQTRNKVWLFISGVFLCWGIFLRPVFILLIFFEFLYLSFFLSKDKIISFRKKIISLLLFLLPFICAESLWVARNYFHNKQVFFLTKTIRYSWSNKDFVAVKDFVSSWGGDDSYEHNAEIFWFEYHQDIFKVSKEKIQQIKFPAYIYTSKFNYDSLVAVKKNIKLSRDTSLTSEQRNHYQVYITDKLNKYSQSIKDEKPAVYYLYAPAKMLVRFIFQSGSHFWFLKPFNTLSILEKCIKLFYSLLYWIIIILGSIGCVSFMINHFRDFNIKFVMSFIPLYFILIHPVFLRLTDERYIIPAYPFLTIIAVNCIFLLYQNWIKKFNRLKKT